MTIVNYLTNNTMSRLHADEAKLYLPHKQRGSALVIGLLILLVITILAISGVRESLMQERMSGNWHDRNLAFQASEAALREGERWLDASVANRRAAEDHNILANPFTWEGADAHGTINLSTGTVSFADDAFFYINPATFTRAPGDIDAANPICDRSFPIYAHGVGGTDNARVTLQATLLPRTSGFVECPADWGE